MKISKNGPRYRSKLVHVEGDWGQKCTKIGPHVFKYEPLEKETEIFSQIKLIFLHDVKKIRAKCLFLSYSCKKITFYTEIFDLKR